MLEKIIAQKRKEVEENKTLYPVKFLERSLHFNAPCLSLAHYLNRSDLSGIIAEFKRKSPSKGMINAYAKPEEVCLGYMKAGSSALSVLTDRQFFGGSNTDLSIARKMNYCPILRKDFIVDVYQIYESRSIGADVILLLANVLSVTEIKQFTKLANDLGMEVLLEIRDEHELDKILPEHNLIGINNRNLKNFTENLDQSLLLGSKIPNNKIKISESGISSANQIYELRKNGFSGFLIGTYFMKHSKPQQVCKKLTTELQLLLQEELHYES